MIDLKPFYLANKPTISTDLLAVEDKFSGQIIANVSMADQAAIETAIQSACNAEEPMRKLPPYARQEILYHCVTRFRDRFDEMAETLCVEAGKPIRDSRGEVTRLIDTFQIAAEESVRIDGEVLNLEISPRAKGYTGMVRRFPIGACSFISPFNFPLNLAAHKIAPAIAVGAPFVLKPASSTPISALIIGEILSQSDLPEGAFSILPCSRTTADCLVTDDRFKLLSFTGSPDVGWDMKQRAGKKKVVLELGGNAACIVDEDADLEDACERLIVGAFYQSGQSCISVQRIMIHQKIYKELRDRLVAKTKLLVAGNPKNEETFIGPVISVKEAGRIMSWIDQAISAGGTLLCGGTQDGPVVAATLLENVPTHQPICSQEVFGPVAILSKFSDFRQAIEETNNSQFGLQAGVFTRDLNKMMYAWEELVVGGVIIGDIPSWRVDNMPYGGVKDSGFGREGVRYAMEDMLEKRIMVIRRTAGELSSNNS